MPKPKPMSINERDFIIASAKDGIRIDSRRLLDMRRIRLRFQDGVSGQVEVLMGKTRVLAAVTATVAEPYPERPNEGFLKFGVEFSPMAAQHFEAGRPSTSAIVTTRLIERGMRDSRAIDVETLCISAGKMVWDVHCDVTVLDFGGNVLDASILASVTALIDFRRPDVTISGDRVTVHSERQRRPVPLDLRHIPFSITLGFFDDGALTIVDPCDREEEVMDGSMTVIITAHRELCVVNKCGGVALRQEDMNRCIEIASGKARELSAVMNAAIKSHVEK